METQCGVNESPAQSQHSRRQLMHTRRKVHYGLLCLLICIISRCTAVPQQYYTNTWAVKVADGKWSTAKELASRYGYNVVDKIMDDYFLFGSNRTKSRSLRRARRTLTSSISHDANVQWMEQQVARKRVKRGSRQGQFISDVDPSLEPNDEWWEEQWYLNEHDMAVTRGLSHHVREAWEMGYSGKGVVVTILDDGLERTHPDIEPNYDPDASFDVNDHDSDPMPRYDDRLENRHGTRCAGEVAAVFNNRRCVVGIAYNARIGGIRMLDGEVTDAVEATSLAHNAQHIDIYSSSWGPEDDGRTLDGPATLARLAFEKGIREGRNGKGSIFVWASGNGGRSNDSCNCDGYTNSIYTLSVSAATENRHVPYYSEACSSTMATTFSSGATGHERMIATTDLRHGCTKQHTGTSAAAPLAAAMVALMLEANKNLTWRDVQHIVVQTSNPRGLIAPDWQSNGVGRNVSHSFGYGLMDAAKMVRRARAWRTVPQQNVCIEKEKRARRNINTADRITIPLTTDGCAYLGNERVTFLEHVQARISLLAPKRGDVQITLVSPMGTRSQLLAKRERDASRSGFRDWAFMTVHMWGERAAGTWLLQIENDGWTDAELIAFELIMYGTAEPVGYNGAMTSAESNAILRSIGMHMSPNSALLPSYSLLCTLAMLLALLMTDIQ